MNELHRKFVILGNNRRKLTNELLALLPEIYEKGIYKKYSATIVEYAGKFGGLSKGVVMKRLRLEKYLEDKPNLKEAIRTEGVHKVALVARLATAETENAWVDKLKNMSKASLFELAKEVREKIEDEKCMNVDEIGIGGGNGSRVDFGFCKAVPQKVKIELEGELLFMFLKMKKKYGKNLSNSEVMKKILEEAVNTSEAKLRSESKAKPQANPQVKVTTQSIQQKVQIFPGKTFSRYEVGTMECENPAKYEPVHEIPEKTTKKATRYVHIKIKKSVLSSTNGKCSYPGCGKPSETLHHPERFAEGQNHNNLKPLCKIHHEFMHNGLVGREQGRLENWRLNLGGELNGIDNLYRKYRRLAA